MYRAKLKRFNYSFVIGLGCIVFGCCLRIIFTAVGEDSFGGLDTVSYWTPMICALCIMAVIFTAFIKLLRVRRQYHVELNMLQVLMANLYMLTFLLNTILTLTLHALSRKLNDNYRDEQTPIQESQFVDSVTQINMVAIGILVVSALGFTFVAIIIFNLHK